MEPRNVVRKPQIKRLYAVVKTEHGNDAGDLIAT
jgi:hypothetical protein